MRRYWNSSEDHDLIINGVKMLVDESDANDTWYVVLLKQTTKIVKVLTMSLGNLRSLRDKGRALYVFDCMKVSRRLIVS
jgi:hypothetical protein